MFSRKIALLQIIVNHHELLPINLIKAIVLLEQHNIDHAVYNIEMSPQNDFETALTELFSKIKENTIIVSLACHNNYPKIINLAFIFLYISLLKNKTIHICSPYLSFYNLSLIKTKQITFHLEEIDLFLNRYFSLPQLSEHVLFARIPNTIKEYGYANHDFWSYLTFGCTSHCSFCYNSSLKKGNPRLIYSEPSKVIAWMKLARSLGKDNFQFTDPNFFSDKQFTLSFLKSIQQETTRLNWRCKLRLDDINKDIYQNLIAAGCRTIYFGVEHVSEKIIRAIHKNEEPAPLLIEFLKYWGQKTDLQLSLMTGFKEETLQDLEKNISFISKLEKLSHLEPILAYNILYNEQRRKNAVENYLILLLLTLNELPASKTVSRKFFKKLLFLCKQNRFFNFFILTENHNSLALFQALLKYCKEKPNNTALEAYNKLFAYENKDVANMAKKATSLRELNRRIENYLLAI